MQSQLLGSGQSQANYFAPAVPGGQDSDLRLLGGQPGQGPFYYSLGVQSTVPFVRLKGGGNVGKVFSWGELIEVPEGQQVTVQNASYMTGDIDILSGLDFAAKPERISVGVPVTTVGGAVTPAFPADTRRCRNAYLYTQWVSGADPITFTFVGKPRRHSFTTTLDAISLPTYIQTFLVPPLTAFGQMPLGFGNSLIPDSAMALTDQVTWSAVFTVGPGGPTPGATPFFMYSLEY
jgi:hypothetical protein